MDVWKSWAGRTATGLGDEHTPNVRRAQTRMGAESRTGRTESPELHRRDRPGALTSPRWFSKEGSRCGRAKGCFEMQASSS
jgi:hypothetical protein